MKEKPCVEDGETRKKGSGSLKLWRVKITYLWTAFMGDRHKLLFSLNHNCFNFSVTGEPNSN